MVTRLLQVESRTGKVRLSETDVLPLCHATPRIDAYLLLVLRNSADKQTTVVDGHADAEEPPTSYLVVIHLGLGVPRVLAARVRHEAVASVGTAEVHHQAELVDPAAALERRHQLVLVTVTRDLTDEDLASSGWRWSSPVRRRTVFPLTILLQHVDMNNFSGIFDQRFRPLAKNSLSVLDLSI